MRAGAKGKKQSELFQNFNSHNIMADVEIKLTENQQKAFDVLLDDVHTAIGY